ncbi:hypothetical protein DTO166G4_7917 [Paecilomyces variotii]|nr:hypothetical protein DTO166G4_7917 [Paecilomyces variotii]KAJ9228113.1 hypothetical protein DTO166G5_8828 [Paecilomyces variotii]KAJ9307616.1 hypothetical protein DTO217A2_2850 [Paecilomyces variotii]
MGFKFSFLCDLLSDLEANRIVKASTAARSRDPDISTINSWFKLHRRQIAEKDTDLLALLSCFFPEKRTDRVYWLQDASLARVIARCLLLGVSRKEELDSWRASGGSDLGQCVENVMRQAENYVPNGRELILEEIDAAMDKLASRCRFSGPRLRRQHTAVDVEDTLGPLYRRVSSRDAKWLTRLILKSYCPVMLPGKFILHKIHFLLPHLLLLQDSFEAAAGMLSTSPLNCFQPCPEPGVARLLCENAIQYLIPRIGIKVGRPDFYKARSIKHCCQMVGRRRMSVERKYDGEYCQIHVNLSQQPDCIQIFSKSGKDSTIDRIGIHNVIKQCLRMGQRDCIFSRRCILEGELLVWSDREEKILEFHKLRKYITRSGAFIGTDSDSQPRPYEHLMIMFYDVLLYDDNICLAWPHRERRLLLKKLIAQIPGRAGIAEQEVIDFSRSDSKSRLERTFARGIAQRWEGFVLKCCDEPYFPILSTEMDQTFGRWIKLKKDYIPGLGDTVDLVLIGGGYNSRDASALKGIQDLLWTHFHVGCLENKNAVSQFNALPKFRIVDVIDHHSLSQKFMHLLNSIGRFRACEPDSNSAFIVQKGRTDLPDMDAAFKVPFVVELLGSGFDKPSNASYFTLRFPRVLKIHVDRAFEETVSFAELQELAEKARSVPTDELLQETATWRKRVEHKDNRSEYIVDRSQDTTVSRCSTPSAASISPSSVSPSSRQVLSTSPSVPRHSLVTHSPGTSPLCQEIQTTWERSRARPVIKRRLSSAFQDVSEEGHQRKNQKISHASEQDIVIFTDNSQVSLQAQQTTPLSSCALTSLDNIQPRKDSAGLGSRGSIMMASVQDENSVSQRATSHQLHDKTEVIERNRSTVVQETGTVSVPQNPDKAIPVKICLRSPLTTIPIYIGRSLSSNLDGRNHIPETRECRVTSDACHFIDELVNTKTRQALTRSNPAAASANVALGVVLVDINHRKRLLDEISTISTELATRISTTQQEVPSKGHLFVLDWRLLKDRTDIESSRFCLRQTWKQIAMDHFHSCITWDHNLSPGNVDRLQVEAQGSAEPRYSLAGQTGMAPGGDNKVSTTIHMAWDCTMLQGLGEFLSIEPLVHVNGDLYVDTKASV